MSKGLRWFILWLIVSSLWLFVVSAQDEVSGTLLDAINAAREEADLSPLVYNLLLEEAAQRHSDDMAARETLSHVGSDGSQFWERIQDTGYVLISGAENVLSRGDTDALAAFQQWYDSAPHRANLLNPRYTEVGIAYTQSANGAYYFTLVLAVSSQPPMTATPSPTMTMTATSTPIPPSPTLTVRPTDIAAATMVAPLPTNTAAPIVPTRTPIPASLATSTPSPTPLPPDIRLIYDRNSFALINVSGRPLNLSELVFQSESGSLTASAWNTEFLTQPLSGFTNGDCLQAWGPEISELPPPNECRIRHAWIVVSGDSLFWRDAQTFTVRNGVERVGLCDVASGLCEFSLTVPLAEQPTPIATSSQGSVGRELPDLNLLYDEQSFSLVNISGGSLDLRGLVFRSETGELPIERWDTEFLSQPLNDFSAGDCLQAWTFAYDLLPKPEECRFRHAWAAIPNANAFWQGTQAFTVERNGVLIGRCVVARERCEISLSANLGNVDSAAVAQPTTVVGGAADIRLHITENSITLQNTSSGNLDVSNLSFSSPSGTFAVSRWNTEALSRPLTELPRLDCLQVWPVGTERQAPAAACEIRHAWVAARPGEVFWQDANTFEVLQLGVSIGRCETRVEFCDINLP